VLDEMNHYEPVGFVDDEPDSDSHRGLPLLGGAQSLRQLARDYPALEVIIALPEAGADRQAKVVALCEKLRLRWSIVPWLFGAMASGLRVDLIGAIPLVLVIRLFNRGKMQRDFTYIDDIVAGTLACLAKHHPAVP
jgi:FlaA1/EpsC-like NDP-sugar epimerase